MAILYYDIFFLLVSWFTGISINVPGMYIHVLPMLALIAVLMRLVLPPALIKITVNPVRAGKKIQR
jgi:hypothetical protein